MFFFVFFNLRSGTTEKQIPVMILIKECMEEDEEEEEEQEEEEACDDEESFVASMGRLWETGNWLVFVFVLFSGWIKSPAPLHLLASKHPADIR